MSIVLFQPTTEMYWACMVSIWFESQIKIEQFLGFLWWSIDENRNFISLDSLLPAVHGIHKYTLIPIYLLEQSINDDNFAAVNDEGNFPKLNVKICDSVSVTCNIQIYPVAANTFTQCVGNWKKKVYLKKHY